MKFRNLENRLAVIAALVVLVGVSTAAGQALAMDFAPAAGLEVTAEGTIYTLTAGDR